MTQKNNLEARIIDDVLRTEISDYDTRKEQLEKTEWQRWTPGLSLLRALKDNVEDCLIRHSTHSRNYNITNACYNALQVYALAIGAYFGLS